MLLAGSFDGASAELESATPAVHAVNVAVQTDLAISSLSQSKDGLLVAVDEQPGALSCSAEAQAVVLSPQTAQRTCSPLKASPAARDKSPRIKLQPRTDSSQAESALNHDSQQQYQRHGDNAEEQPQMSHAHGLERADARDSGPQQPSAAGLYDRLQDDASSHQRQPSAAYSDPHSHAARIAQAQLDRGSAESTRPMRDSRKSDDALLRQAVALQEKLGTAQAAKHSTRVSQEVRRKAESHWTQGLVLPEQLSVCTLAKHAGVDKAFMQVCTACCAVLCCAVM